MGFDRGVLPKDRDRDRDETYPWMGLLAILVIVGGMFLIMLLAGVWSADPVPTVTTPRSDSQALTVFL